MALPYNYYVDKANYTNTPSIRAYSYQSRPASRETKADNSERYPNLIKFFNNRRGFDEKSSVAENTCSQQPKTHPEKAKCDAERESKKTDAPHPRRKVRFAEQSEVIGFGGSHKTNEAEVVKEEGIDAAADGFIDWKRRSLQMCKSFAD